MADTLGGLLLVAGAALFLVAGIGAVRFPDVMAQMHAAAKVPTLGILLIALGAAIRLDDARSTAKLAAAVLVVFLTGPIAAHLVARAAADRAAGEDPAPG